MFPSRHNRKRILDFESVVVCKEMFITLGTGLCTTHKVCEPSTYQKKQAHYVYSCYTANKRINMLSVAELYLAWFSCWILLGNKLLTPAHAIADLFSRNWSPVATLVAFGITGIPLALFVFPEIAVISFVSWLLPPQVHWFLTFVTSGIFASAWQCFEISCLLREHSPLITLYGQVKMQSSLGFGLAAVARSIWQWYVGTTSDFVVPFTVLILCTLIYLLYDHACPWISTRCLRGFHAVAMKIVLYS